MQMYKCCDITDSKFLLFTQLDLLEEIYISIILYITRLVCFAWVVKDKKEAWSDRRLRQRAPKRGRPENIAKMTEQRKKLVADKEGTWRACRQCGWVRKIPYECRQQFCARTRYGPWGCGAQFAIAGWLASSEV